MALSSVHFEPTTQNFGKLTVRAMKPAAALSRTDAWKMTTPQTPATIHLLIGLAFVLAFLATLSGLYLVDQAVFGSITDTATAQNTAYTQNTAYNGAMIDYD